MADWLAPEIVMVTVFRLPPSPTGLPTIRDKSLAARNLWDKPQPYVFHYWKNNGSRADRNIETGEGGDADIESKIEVRGALVLKLNLSVRVNRLDRGAGG